MKKFIKEFKEFAIKDNVFELAIAVIIGNAIKDIVTSLVTYIFTPILGIFVGRVDIKTLALTINSRFIGANPITIGYGNFLESVLNFLITSFCIFLMIKMMSKLRNFTFSKSSKNPEPEPVRPKTEDLLVEIRDLLKQQVAQKAPSDLPEDLEQEH